MLFDTSYKYLVFCRDKQEISNSKVKYQNIVICYYNISKKTRFLVLRQFDPIIIQCTKRKLIQTIFKQGTSKMM